MNPIEHGEVFVTEDGDETDQDIGNYERFRKIFLNKLYDYRPFETVIRKKEIWDLTVVALRWCRTFPMKL